ncbi:MAG: ABC transporter permease [Planctomycetota bacterium]
MRWIRTLRLSLKSLLLHPMRSGLTVLGILIGVASVIWLLAIGEGISRASQNQIANLGAKNIIIRTIKPTGDDFDGSGYGLTRADYQLLQETIPTVEVTLPIREVEREFRFGARRIEGRLVGVTPDYTEVLNLKLDRGRFINPADMEAERNVCVLAWETSERLFPQGESVGESVMVDDEFYTVIGVAEPKAATAGVGGSLAAEDFSSDIYIPIQTFWRRLGDMMVTTKPGQYQRDLVEVSQISLRVRERDDVLPTADLVRETIDRNHLMDDYAITVPLELLIQARTTQLMFIVFLGLIAAISLVVGGIGIMNIMLATVTERTQEIGIRRALGAKRKDIVGQFLTESVVLSVVGGALGIVAGLFCPLFSRFARDGLAQLFPRQFATLPDLIRELEPVLVMWSIPLAFVIAAGVGVLFGVYPATRAAALDPIVALRRN